MHIVADIFEQNTNTTSYLSALLAISKEKITTYVITFPIQTTNLKENNHEENNCEENNHEENNHENTHRDSRNNKHPKIKQELIYCPCAITELKDNYKYFKGTRSISHTSSERRSDSKFSKIAQLKQSMLKEKGSEHIYIKYIGDGYYYVRRKYLRYNLNMDGKVHRSYMYKKYHRSIHVKPRRDLSRFVTAIIKSIH